MKRPAAWKRRFDEPILLGDGNALLTLENAADYIQDLPEAEHLRPEWQTAIGALVLAVELNGPTMMARIAMMQALNRDRPPPKPAPRRKKAKAYRIIPAQKA